MLNKEIAEELQTANYKPIIKKVDKQKGHSPFKNNIWVLILPICN